MPMTRSARILQRGRYEDIMSLECRVGSFVRLNRGLYLRGYGKGREDEGGAWIEDSNTCLVIGV